MLLPDHFRRMQVMAAHYLEPGPYTDREGREHVTPTQVDAAFAADMVHMLDGPEQRAADALRLALVGNSNLYDNIARITGLDRKDVKRVLLAAAYAGAPVELPAADVETREEAPSIEQADKVDRITEIFDLAFRIGQLSGMVDVICSTKDTP